MNLRMLYSIGLFGLGLLLGILVGRWLMPDRYGLVTMVLLTGGGIVVGAMLMRAVRLPRKKHQAETTPMAPIADVAQTPYQPQAVSNSSAALSPVTQLEGWRWNLGASRVVIRYDAGWWARHRANWRSRFAPQTDHVPGVAIACLFGAVGLALYGQFAFAGDKTFTMGVLGYLIAIVCFVFLMLLLDSPEDKPSKPVVVASPSDSSTTSGVRFALILVSAVGAGIAAFVGATTVWNAPQPINIVLWASMCLLYVCAFLPWSELAARTRVRDSRWIGSIGERLWLHRVELILLFAILVVAFVVRYWRLAWIPGIFGGDEGEMGAEAVAILQGELKNPFITGWLSHGTMYFFMQASILKFLGPTIFGLRLSSVLAGTLSIFVAYLLIRRLFTVRLALLTAGLLAVFNFHIHFSRLALNNIFDSLFAPLALLFYYVGLESRRPLYFALAGMTMGLAVYFYHGARLIPIIVVVFALYLLVTQRALIFKNLLNFVWLGLGALIVAGPLLHFFYLHPNDFMARLAQRGIFQSGWFEKQIESGRTGAEILLEQVRRSFFAFNAVPDPTTWFGTGMPLLDPLSGMFFVFGIVYSLFKWSKKNYALLVIWLVLGVFFGSTLLENPPTSPSFVIVTVPAMFFVALGLEKLLEFAAQLLRPLARVRSVAALLIVLVIGVWGLAFYFIEYTPRYVYGGEPNWVIRTLVEHLQTRTDKYRVYFVAPPYIYLGIGSRKFLMPQLKGEDVLDPITSANDLTFVRPSHPALFVFVPAREKELPIVQQTYPGGTVLEFAKPDGKPLFTIYQVNTP